VTGGPRLSVLLQELEGRRQHSPHDSLVRRVVRLRANDACEYCLHSTVGQFHIDHIIPADVWAGYTANEIPGLSPIKGRRGPNHLDNLAWCCPFCNEGKGQRITTRVQGHVQRLFDPRYDGATWPRHFAFLHQYLYIVGITPLGLATEQALNFNDGRRGGPLATRHDTILRRRYPPRWARPLLV